MFLFSFVFLGSLYCFLIQTGLAGSHCKSIASSELKLNIKRVRDCPFVFCFQIHALAYCTMKSKFSILHSASLRAVLKISSSLYSKQVRVFENKILTTVSLTIRPVARKGYGSIAHEAKPNGLLTRGP